MRPEFLWERVEPRAPDLFLLLPTDVTWVATRLSCDQDIAGDAFFSLGMLARFEPRSPRTATGCIGGCSGSAG